MPEPSHPPSGAVPVNRAVQDVWNARHRQRDAIPHAALVLQENAHLLPRQGHALEVACGLGGNALFLAARGLETLAWDISDVAISRLQQEARQRQLPVTAQLRDLSVEPMPEAQFDVLVVSRFLDRGMMPGMIQALRPGGLLFYQTFTRIKVDAAMGPDNPEYRLDVGELLVLFGALQILHYREEGRVGDLQKGFRNEAMLVGKKVT
ncbi:MAG: methyltransferase domain-containing protein [Magnetococcales bacterium]|nr:methyltransferase domain-containing protein [Magnetococcales bacterium]